MDNINEFITAVEQFEEQYEMEVHTKVDPIIILEAFLEKVALVSQIDQLQESDDALICMTVHSAKGLEFAYVFLAGMEEGLFPHFRSLDSDEELEEERRLCYVGITRAQKRAYMTCAESRKMFGRMEWTMPSRFIEEIPKQYKDEISWQGSVSGAFRSSGMPEWFTDPDRSSQIQQDLFVPGDMVNHRSFGFGVVLSVEGSGPKAKLTVDFQDFGKKTLIQEFAKLTKV